MAKDNQDVKELISALISTEKLTGLFIKIQTFAKIAKVIPKYGLLYDIARNL